MRYYTVQPPAILADYVRFFWVLEYEVPANQPYIYRSLADGCAELIFHYKGRFKEITDRGSSGQGCALIHAQSQQFRRFITDEQFGIFGVYLYPFALPQLFSVPASELSNEMPDLEMIVGVEGRELEEKMVLATTNAVRVQLICDFLESRLNYYQSDKSGINLSVKQVICSKENLNVSQLANQFNLSPRQFERRFKAYSGFSPKLYSLIIRFQSSLKEYRNSDKLLTEIAYESGYYDQSHFIHDFKEFSGFHPKHYFSGGAEGSEYRNT